MAGAAVWELSAAARAAAVREVLEKAARVGGEMEGGAREGAVKVDWVGGTTAGGGELGVGVGALAMAAEGASGCLR